MVKNVNWNTFFLFIFYNLINSLWNPPTKTQSTQILTNPASNQNYLEIKMKDRVWMKKIRKKVSQIMIKMTTSMVLSLQAMKRNLRMQIWS